MTYTQPIPLLDLKAQYAPIREEIRAALDRVADAQYFIGGPEVEGLEREIAAYSQCQFGIGVTSGTDALLVALMAIGIQPGDEVITTPYTFFATGGCIHRLGAMPVFVDIDPDSYNIDPALIEAAIAPKTKAIMPVHLYGQMADMDPIMEIAGRHNLFVIEDAAQAIGAEYKGRRAGSIGHFGCFSFFPSKNLGGFGDGGMVTTNDRGAGAQSQAAAQSRRGAEVLPQAGRRQLPAGCAAGSHSADQAQLPGRLDRRPRNPNAARYRRIVQRRSGVRTSSCRPKSRSAGTSTTSSSSARSRRDAVMAKLKERKIGHEIYYPVPLHLQECFAALGYEPGSLPASERAAAETLALPIYPELTEEMQMAVVNAIAEAYS